MKKNPLLFLLLIVSTFCRAQEIRGLVRIVDGGTSQPASLSIVGADSLGEGTTKPYRIILTSPTGTTADVSETARFSASRGSASGLTITPGKPINLTNASNTVRGDDRITTLRATYQTLSTSREIVLTDATTGYVAVAPRLVNAADINRWPQMKTGDLIVEGATFVVANQGDYSIQIRSSQTNVPTLQPGATVWVKGARYINFTLQLNQSRVPVGQPPIQVRNYDGQVEIQNTLTLLGAQGAKISGKYEATTGVGDSDYQGHGKGSYAFTTGRYGWLLNNKYLDKTRPALTMDGGVRDIEWEFMEVKGGYFTAMLFNARNYDMNIPTSTTYLPFENINIHDFYIHDLDGEGIYLGSTELNLKAHFKGGSFYNSRVLRVGNEGLQFGQLNSGMRVFNNVVHSNFNWRDPFQRYQDNSLQLALFEGVRVYNNLFLSGGEKQFTVLARGDTAINSVASRTDTLLIRNNAFLYNRGWYEGFLSTLGVAGVRNPIKNLTLAIDRNLFGKNTYAYNQVYTNVPEQNYLFLFDLLGTDTDIRVTNNVYDGSSKARTRWVLNSGPTPIFESANSLNGFVPHPAFENYMGLPPDYQYSRIEKWAGVVGSESGFTASGTLKGTLITVPIGDIRFRNGIGYESKAANNTNIEPTVAPDWQNYWNVLYWDRRTGELIRNPTNLSNLSTTPPDNTRLLNFYKDRGIGVY
ncbi:hypothetical protein [Spirosoma linguale]|uniref:Right handed beta helix domain-containing protein n=1 Tax=Spirosoma linguale (strain ATCC 33905 / DSM 74 / LMG 10896 / Claus 1) TaxID=504472 RepID=D2QEM1_SPILD|nr:hypothetical protein Slin_2252 [Spirosoma linguale DSM 74]